MNTATQRDVFITSTPANFHHGAPRGHTSSHPNRDQGKAGGSDTSSCQKVPVGTSAEFMDLQTVKHVLHVLKEGGMDVVGFLDALCWGNSVAVADPTIRSARTSLTHSDRLAEVVSR